MNFAKGSETSKGLQRLDPLRYSNVHQWGVKADIAIVLFGFSGKVTCTFFDFKKQ